MDFESVPSYHRRLLPQFEPEMQNPELVIPPKKRYREFFLRRSDAADDRENIWENEFRSLCRNEDGRFGGDIRATSCGRQSVIDRPLGQHNNVDVSPPAKRLGQRCFWQAESAKCDPYLIRFKLKGQWLQTYKNLTESEKIDGCEIDLKSKTEDKSACPGLVVGMPTADADADANTIADRSIADSSTTSFSSLTAGTTANMESQVMSQEQRSCRVLDRPRRGLLYRKFMASYTALQRPKEKSCKSTNTHQPRKRGRPKTASPKEVEKSDETKNALHKTINRLTADANDGRIGFPVVKTSVSAMKNEAKKKRKKGKKVSNETRVSSSCGDRSADAVAVQGLAEVAKLQCAQADSQPMRDANSQL